MHDRLIELISKAREECLSTSCFQCEYQDKKIPKGCVSRLIADHLLANDIIIPPCKVGDTAYRISKRYGEWCVLPRTVCSIRYLLDSRGNIAWYLFTTTEDRIGETVFTTREEAEQALLKP